MDYKLYKIISDNKIDRLLCIINNDIYIDPGLQ